MKTINFEGLGISFNINNVFFNINGFKIYWYALFIVISILISLLFCKRDSGKYHISFDDILELYLFILPISIIFARLYYVLFNLNYYIINPLEILNIRNGGLAIYGAIIGGIITIIIFCKKKCLKILDILDYLIPYLALGQSIGRLGNFVNEEAYGTETTNIFRMGIFKSGTYIQVHPTFLYESICTFIIFVILFKKKEKRKYPGQLTFLYFFLYGIIRAIIENFRTDSLMFKTIRVSQLLSIFSSIIFGIILYKKYKQNKKTDINN